MLKVSIFPLLVSAFIDEDDSLLQERHSALIDVDGSLQRSDANAASLVQAFLDEDCSDFHSAMEREIQAVLNRSNQIEPSMHCVYNATRPGCCGSSGYVNITVQTMLTQLLALLGDDMTCGSYGAALKDIVNELQSHQECLQERCWDGDTPPSQCFDHGIQYALSVAKAVQDYTPQTPQDVQAALTQLRDSGVDNQFGFGGCGCGFGGCGVKPSYSGNQCFQPKQNFTVFCKAQGTSDYTHASRLDDYKAHHAVDGKLSLDNGGFFRSGLEEHPALKISLVKADQVTLVDQGSRITSVEIYPSCDDNQMYHQSLYQVFIDPNGTSVHHSPSHGVTGGILCGAYRQAFYTGGTKIVVPCQSNAAVAQEIWIQKTTMHSHGGGWPGYNGNQWNSYHGNSPAQNSMWPVAFLDINSVMLT